MTTNLAINEHTKSKKIGKHTIAINPTIYPRDEGLEYQVIGQLLAAGDSGQGIEKFRLVNAYLTSQDFFTRKLQWVYNAIAEIVETGQDYDTQAVISQLRQSQGSNMTALEYVGGEFELLEIANTKSDNLETHAKKMVGLSLRRQMASHAHAQSELVLKEDNLDEQLEQLGQWYGQIRLRHQNLKELSTYNLSDALTSHSENLVHNPTRAGTPIWIPELQNYLHGWKKKRLYILAAGTSMGKSAWLFSAAIEAAKQGQKVVFFTFEMSVEELMNRFLAIISNVDGVKFQDNDLNDNDTLKMAQGIQDARKTWLHPDNFHIESMNMPNANDIRSKLDMHTSMGQCDIVFIDYISTETMSFIKEYHNQRPPHSTEHANQLWNQMRQIKSEYDVPFILGAQVNRDYEKGSREDMRPRKTDIANSSKAENAADVIMLLHRMAIVDKISPETHADIDIAKNRHGKITGQDYIKLHYDTTRTYFQGRGGDA